MSRGESVNAQLHYPQSTTRPEVTLQPYDPKHIPSALQTTAYRILYEQGFFRFSPSLICSCPLNTLTRRETPAIAVSFL